MAFAILGTPKPAFFDSSGSPLVSGTLAVLDPADDTNKASYPTYDDAEAATNANANPVVLDSRGEISLWGLDSEDYKLVLKDSAGTTIWTTDDVFLPTLLTTFYKKTAQTLTDAGAVTLTESTTFVVTTGAAALTLADGTENQHKLIVMKTDAGVATLTPSNLSNGTTIVFDDVGDSASLWFIDGSWSFLGGSATVTGYTADTAVTFTSTDATPDVNGGKTFITAGTTAITDFDLGVVGDTIKILAASIIVITHGSPVSLRGEVSFSMVVGDTITLHMFNDQVWEELSRTYAKAFTKFKTADEALTSSTLADDTHLKDWVLQPNTYYRFEGYLHVTADAGSRDLEIDITTDNAFVEEMYTWVTQDGAGVTIDGEAGTIPLTTAIAQIDIDGTANVGISLKGFVLTHATSACNVDFQFANTAGAGTVTVNKGSWASFTPYEY